MKLIFEEHLPQHRLHLVKFDARGERVALLGKDAISAPLLLLYERGRSGWRCISRKEISTRLSCAAFSLDSAHILVSSESGLFIFDIQAQRFENIAALAEAAVGEVEWLNHDRITTTVPESWPPANILSLKGHKPVLPLIPPLREVPKHFPRLAKSHDGGLIAFCHTFEFVYLFDTIRGSAVLWGNAVGPAGSAGIARKQPWEWTHFARRIWFSKNDTEIAVASQPRDRSEWAQMGIRIGTRDGSKQRLLRINSHMGAVDMSPSFNVVAAAIAGQPGDVGIWDVQTNDLQDVIRVGCATRDIRYSGDGGLMVIACEESFSIFEL